jgi:RNA polymerase sigma-70 factor (ECF subfamily)
VQPLDIKEAYGRLFPPVHAKCRRILGQSQASEDVAQEAFVRLWRSGLLERESGIQVVMAWLYRTATRLSIDVLRDRGGRVAPPAPDEAFGCAVDLGTSTEARRLIAALAASVPKEELAAAVLCRVDGLSQLEAATVLEVSERTLRRTLSRFDERTVSFRKEFTS